MKILKNKTYQELLDYKSKYFELLWKPFQGVFEKVTDDELLRDNANLHVELQEALDSITWWHNRFNSEHAQLEDEKNKIKKIEDFLSLALEIYDNVDLPTLKLVKDKVKEIKGESDGNK